MHSHFRSHTLGDALLMSTSSLACVLVLQVLAAFASAFHVIQPSTAPGFAFAWLELISHRYASLRHHDSAKHFETMYLLIP